MRRNVPRGGGREDTSSDVAPRAAQPAHSRRAHPAAAPPPAALRRAVAPFEGGDDRQAWRALATSLPPYLALWALMAALPPGPVPLLLAVPAAAFLVRTFIVAHDCGHGAFFRSARLNTWTGRLCALPALVPFGWWRRSHAVHHATAGKLERRGADVPTLTVREYRALGAGGRLAYRLARHPLVLFGVAPALYFGVALRLPVMAPPAWRRERRGIWLTNLALAALFGGLAWALGWRTVARVQAPVSLVAATVGMWLFYVQHQFEDTYWADAGRGTTRAPRSRGRATWTSPPRSPGRRGTSASTTCTTSARGCRATGCARACGRCRRSARGRASRWARRWGRGGWPCGTRRRGGWCRSPPPARRLSRAGRRSRSSPRAPSSRAGSPR
jgi:omega-6 fatty acid desaturase (delta-12 desaturase)